jgi:hypothetical protein
VSINEDEEWAPRLLKETPLEVYASFSGRRGGLLKVLQAVLLAGQIAIAHFTNARLGFWAPALLLPLMLVYYPLRNLIWERVYRRYGQLDAMSRPGEVGQSLLRLVATLGTLLIIRNGTETIPIGFIWLVVPLGSLVLWGRLPADEYFAFASCFLVLTSVYSGLLYSRSLPWLLLSCVTFPVIGIYEHRMFLRNGKPGPENRT